MLIFIYVLIGTVIAPTVKGLKGEFKIDESSESFILNGHPYRIVSGGVDYFRVHSGQWDDILKKIRAAGFNTIQTAIEWSSHQPSANVFDFEGENNLEHFLELAKNNGLRVIVKTGPYIGTNRDMGGLPPWILRHFPSMKLRTSDGTFLRLVENYYKQLYPRLEKFLIKNSGPVIMVQIEHEYGSFLQETNTKYDTNYVTKLVEMANSYLGNDKVVLITADKCDVELLKLGQISGVYSTVEYGKDNIADKCIQHLRKYVPKGPVYISELFSGVADHWAESHGKIYANQFSAVLNYALSQQFSLNVHMVYGGTNFGFKAGASPPFKPVVTSYDYDAPINEGGDITPKYTNIKATLGNYGILSNVDANQTTDKGRYGKIPLKLAGSLLMSPTLFHSNMTTNSMALTFEALGQNYGFVMHQTVIIDNFRDPAKLEIVGLRDRGYIFLDGILKGILNRMENIVSLPLSLRGNQTLQIVVENQGRISSGGGIHDLKGITSNITINGNVIGNWTVYGFPFDDVNNLTNTLINQTDILDYDLENQDKLLSFTELSHGAMTFWIGKFKTPCNDSGSNTFASMKGWHKGVLFINGFNLGRYWPAVGPQETLFVPGSVLRCCGQYNDIVIFEQDRAPCQRCYKHRNATIEFVTSDELDIDVPS